MRTRSLVLDSLVSSSFFLRAGSSSVAISSSNFFRSGSNLLDLLAKPVASVAVVFRIPLLKIGLRGRFLPRGLTALEKQKGQGAGRYKDAQVHLNGNN